MKIKICGLKNSADIDYVNEAMPDYIGFVFAESKRRVSAEVAAEYKKKLNPKIIAVGVFVNAAYTFIEELYNKGVINIAQLHGTETEYYIEILKKTCDIPVIKAINAGNPYPANADYLLFDSGKGGTGKSFDWSLIPECSKNIFLAGGINLGNIKEAKKLNPYCIDLSSGAEDESGNKNREKIIEITQIIRREI
ncbi:MAG: phosphoribosylanthranilate isomerase [Fibromonadaceae bacterium]|jgi:phosphoribosylanthranilate isomerase|nr:phosphoribosylanthranilate isomerase [Fibromonadaceae bacterium]